MPSQYVLLESMRVKDLPFSCLVGPLSPELSWKQQKYVHPLAPPGCLGSYRQHPQIHCFEMLPEMLLENEAALSILPHIIQQGRQTKETLQFGATTQYLLAPLLSQLDTEVLIWWGIHHPLPLDLVDLPVFKLLIVSDWHFYAQSLPAALNVFDLILCDRLLLHKLQAQGFDNVMYWPAFSFDPDLISPAAQLPHQQRELELVFLGKQHPAYYQKRNHLLWQWAASDLPMVLGQMPHAEYLETLAHSQIVFNHALRRELNLRSAEVAASGALLFCEDSNLEVFDILPAGEACVAYTPENLLEKMRYYQQYADERQAIAIKGQSLIQDYSYEANFARLLAQLPEWRKRFEKKAHLQTQATKHSPERDVLCSSASESQRLYVALPAALDSWRLSLGQAEMHLVSAKPVGRIHALILIEQAYEELNTQPQPDPDAMLWLAFAYYAHCIACRDLETYLEPNNKTKLSEQAWPVDLSLKQPLPRRRQSLEQYLKLFVSRSLAQHDVRVDLILHNLAWGAQMSQNNTALAEYLGQIQARQQAGHRNLSTQALLGAQAYLNYLLPLRSGPQYLLRQNLALLSRDEHWTQGHSMLLEAGELYLLAHWALVQGQNEAAFAALQGVQQRVPSWAEIYFACAKLGLQSQDIDTACQWIEAGLHHGVYYPEIWVLWLDCLRQLGQDQELQQRRYEAARLFQGSQYAEWQPCFANRLSEC